MVEWLENDELSQTFLKSRSVGATFSFVALPGWVSTDGKEKEPFRKKWLFTYKKLGYWRFDD